MKIYNKYRKIIEYIIYPLALIMLPLTNYNQGVDVSDSTYSLGNYLFVERMEGMWGISTYLSNVVGSLIVKLPGAMNLKGANIYTGLILGTIGLIVYFALKDDFDARYVFLGEFAALAFCWIPTGILYNYLSYLFMTAGTLLLYKGIVVLATKNDKTAEPSSAIAGWEYLLAAGFVLGLNVFVRIPNVTQMALIVVLWFACFLTKKNCIKPTLICVGGYVVGVAIPGIVILIKYGIGGITEMVSGLSAVTSADETYTPLSMITGPIKAYIFSAKWLALIILVIVCGCIMFKMMPDKFRKIKTIIYICVIALMLRFFWGRGMFSFRYYEDYTSMYEWGVIALYLSIVVDLWFVVKAIKTYRNQDVSGDLHKTVMATISLVIIMIAPLGSNNNLYQNLNNLFLVMPFTIYVVFGWIKSALVKKNYTSVPVAFMLYALLICILIQSFGFSQNFVFRDGMRGEKRDTKITGVTSLEGMYTNETNAKTLEGLCIFIEEECADATEVILFGDCPGLTYILGKPSALFSSWIDLESNSAKRMNVELDELKDSKDNIPVIVRKVEGSAASYEEKKGLIDNYIVEAEYQLQYENEMYKVYTK